MFYWTLFKKIISKDNLNYFVLTELEQKKIVCHRKWTFNCELIKRC